MTKARPGRRAPYTTDGAKGFVDAEGVWVCTGARLGRRNRIPDDYTGQRLQLDRMTWHDGDYDEGGAYWGRGNSGAMWCAWGASQTEAVELYVRAPTRLAATSKLQELLPGVRFKKAK